MSLLSQNYILGSWKEFIDVSNGHREQFYVETSDMVSLSYLKFVFNISVAQKDGILPWMGHVFKKT